jgi:hypothetical protein
MQSCSKKISLQRRVHALANMMLSDHKSEDLAGGKEESNNRQRGLRFEYLSKSEDTETIFFVPSKCSSLWHHLLKKMISSHPRRSSEEDTLGDFIVLVSASETSMTRREYKPILLPRLHPPNTTLHYNTPHPASKHLSNNLHPFNPINNDQRRRRPRIRCLTSITTLPSNQHHLHDKHSLER